jgi:hypothetical protein
MRSGSPSRMTLLDLDHTSPEDDLPPTFNVLSINAGIYEDD